MNIKQLIQCLNEYDYDDVVENILHNPHSYRGYYEELALERSNQNGTVGELIQLLESCIGKTYTGYKGGEYIMKPESIVNVSDYGTTGGEVVDVFKVYDEVHISAPSIAWY